MTEAITVGDYGFLNIFLTDKEKKMNVGYLGRPKSTVYRVHALMDEDDLWVVELGTMNFKQIPKRYFNKFIFLKDYRRRRDEVKASSSGKAKAENYYSHCENLKRKISQLENENLQLKKKNTESNTLIEGLRKENVRINEEVLQKLEARQEFLPVRQKLPTELLNYIFSLNKSVYKNRLEVRFYIRLSYVRINLVWDERLDMRWREGFFQSERLGLDFLQSFKRNRIKFEIRWVGIQGLNIKVLLDNVHSKDHYEVKLFISQILEKLIEVMASPSNAPMQTCYTFTRFDKYPISSTLPPFIQGALPGLIHKNDYKHLEFEVNPPKSEIGETFQSFRQSGYGGVQ